MFTVQNGVQILNCIMKNVLQISYYPGKSIRILTLAFKFKCNQRSTVSDK